MNEEEDGPWFSVSQVNDWLLCPAKWGFSKINRLPTRESKGQKLGTEVHGENERWLRDATPFNLTTRAGNIANAGCHLLPDPKAPGMDVEEWFYVTLGGHQFRGKKDFQILDRGPLPPLVSDHKTTKSIEKYAITEGAMATDVQSAVYAVDAMIRQKTDRCELQWTYYQTVGRPVAEPRRAVVSLPQIAPTLRRVARAADAMAAVLKSGARAEQLPKVLSACNKFGECEFMGACLSPAEIVRRNVMSEQANLTDMVLGQLNGTATANGPPPPAPVAAAPPAQPPPGAHWDGKQYLVWNGSTWSPWIPAAAPVQAAPPPPPPAAINPPPMSAPAPVATAQSLAAQGFPTAPVSGTAGTGIAPAPPPATEPAKRTRKAAAGAAETLDVNVLRYQVAIGQAAAAALAAMGAT